ncbi:hypothetical protein D9758_007704 [Tetrapyrgos nigripes]|uniref:Uncharacterized protein n=1 Tax=Tetrapyrgos nigripes TaxID=182062 RepID=A0A8H5G5N9_9AGAR|nr:hypothetical protein D9758_007704 [Tetrapyrgos nigripes]
MSLSLLPIDMSTPISVFSFPKASDTSHDDLAASLQAKPEVVRVAHGSRMENPDQSEFVIFWTPDATPSIPSELSKHCTGEHKIHHVKFQNKDAAYKALKAPVTEFITFSCLNPEKDLSALEGLLKQGNDLHLGAPGYHDGDAGFIDDGQNAVVIAGWDSKEAHAAFAATGVIKPVFAQWMQYINPATIVVYHVSLNHLE